MTKTEKLFKIYDWIRDNGERVAKENPWSMESIRRMVQRDTGLRVSDEDLGEVRKAMECKWPFREPIKERALTLKTLDARLTAIENGVEELAKKVTVNLYHVKELGYQMGNLELQISHFREHLKVPFPHEEQSTIVADINEETLKEATDRFEREILNGAPTAGPSKGFLLGQWNGCTPTCGATCRARCDKNPEL